MGVPAAPPAVQLPSVKSRAIGWHAELELPPPDGLPNIGLAAPLLAEPQLTAAPPATSKALMVRVPKGTLASLDGSGSGTRPECAPSEGASIGGKREGLPLEASSTNCSRAAFCRRSTSIEVDLADAPAGGGVEHSTSSQTACAMDRGGIADGHAGATGSQRMLLARMAAERTCKPEMEMRLERRSSSVRL